MAYQSAGFWWDNSGGGPYTSQSDAVAADTRAGQSADVHAAAANSGGSSNQTSQWGGWGAGGINSTQQQAAAKASATPQLGALKQDTGADMHSEAGTVPTTPAPPASADAPNSQAWSPAKSIQGIEGYVMPQQATRGAQTQDIVNKYGAVQMDTGQSDQSRGWQQNALSMDQQLYDKLTSYDPEAEAKKASDQALQNQVALAKSGGGGAGARQASMFQALQQAPAIQQQAQDQALATQRSNLNQASIIASNYANTAGGTRGQDITQSQDVADVGLKVADGISNAVGRDMQLTSGEAQFLGQMQMAVESADQNWAQLSETERENAFNDIMKAKGLQQQWDEFQAGQKLTVKDVVGGIVSLGGEAVGGAFKLAASK